MEACSSVSEGRLKENSVRAALNGTFSGISTLTMGVKKLLAFVYGQAPEICHSKSVLR